MTIGYHPEIDNYNYDTPSTNKVLERIVQLAGNGYSVRISPYSTDPLLIEIRLTKDNANVARIIDPDKEHQAYCWKSDEEWFLYTLLSLEMQYESYVNRFTKQEVST